MGHTVMNEYHKEDMDCKLRQILHEECPRAHNLTKYNRLVTNGRVIVNTEGVQYGG
jgi:hypothetical protein